MNFHSSDSSNTTDDGNFLSRGWRRFQGWPRWAQIAAVVVVVGLVIAGIASPDDEEDQDTTDAPDVAIVDNEDDDDDEPSELDTDDDEATEPDDGQGEEDSPEPEQGPPFDSATIEALFIDGLGGREISQMCDPAYTHWACFYEGVETEHGFLRVNLVTDGGWSADDLAEMGERAAQHWFNFIGCDYPDLDTIVATINGLDHNNYRRNFPSVGC